MYIINSCIYIYIILKDTHIYLYSNLFSLSYLIMMLYLYHLYHAITKIWLPGHPAFLAAESLGSGAMEDLVGATSVWCLRVLRRWEMMKCRWWEMYSINFFKETCIYIYVYKQTYAYVCMYIYIFNMCIYSFFQTHDELHRCYT